MLNILLIRHGDPDYPNNTITELGHRQSKALAEALRDEKIDVLYSSPLGRVLHTVQYTSDLRKQSFEVLEWIGELAGNYSENLYSWVLSGVETHGSSQPVSMENWESHVPYAAHMKPIQEELYSNFDGLLSKHGVVRSGNLYAVDSNKKEETIAIFCHGGVICTLLAHLCHLPLPVAYTQFGCDPSSRALLKLEVMGDKGNFRLMSLNDMSHARELQCSVMQDVVDA